MGHQGTLGVATEATLKLYPKPEAELSPFWAFDDYETAHRALREIVRTDCATFAGAVLFDEQKVAYLRRDDEAYIPQPADVRALVCAVLYGNEDEVRAGGKRLMRAAQGERRTLPRRRDLPGRLGRAPRPLRHPAARPHEGRPGRADELALRGRGDQLDRAPRRQRASGTRSSRGCASARDVFDDWGMFAYTSARTGVELPHRDRRRHLGAGARRRDVGDVGRRQARHRRASRSSTAARSAPVTAPAARARSTSCPHELGGGYDVMKHAQAHARPEQRDEPGQVRARRRVRGGPEVSPYRAPSRTTPPPAAADERRRDHALRAHLRGRPAS